MKPVLDFIKAHTFALACAIVAVIGLVAYFVYPIPGMFADLQAKVHAREAVHQSLSGLLAEKRTVPAIDANAIEPAALTVFPTARVVEQGKKLVQSLTDEAASMLKVAVKRNARTPLVPEALPAGGTIARQRFLDEYKTATAQVGENAEGGVIRQFLSGTLPPSADELKAIGDRRAAQIVKDEMQYGPTGQPTNQAVVDAKITAMRSQLPLQQRLVRAFGSKIYVSPNAVQVNPVAQSTQVPDLITVFNAQFSLWIQQMVFEAIATANGGAKNVFDAPVKHLISLNVPMNYVAGAGATGPVGFGSSGPISDAPGGDGGAAAAAAAAAAASAGVDLKPDPTAAITPAFAQDPLGYTHNNFYDPVQVKMVLRVELSKLPDVLRSLQTGRLVKVRNVQFRTVDMGRALLDGYIYFQQDATVTPLVDVALDCDVLFLRQWLVNYMPDPVKRYFAALATPGAAGPAGAVSQGAGQG